MWYIIPLVIIVLIAFLFVYKTDIIKEKTDFIKNYIFIKIYELNLYAF